MGRLRSTALPALALALAASGCSLATSDDGGADATDASGKPTTVVLVTHESFSLPDDLIAQFEKSSGYRLQIRSSGDAGTLTSQLVLNADHPLGDVAFGIDNTFASRALDAGVFAPSDIAQPDGVSAFDLTGDDEHRLTPIDNASVCVNVDTTWFKQHDLAPPTNLDDLLKPAYNGLFVTPGATTSSPGLAFLLTTIAAKGEDWTSYWKQLLANDARVVDGWSDAYQVDFTQGGGKGDRPIVLSYDSSPAFTVADGVSSTKALLDTCFRQVEYAGVLDGANNPDGAEQLIDFLLSPEVQAALPDSMYVFPVRSGVALPKEWATFAVQPTKPYDVDPAEITANRDTWLREWSDLIS